jgi:hypothetical protein
MYGLSATVVIHCSLFTHYVRFERYCCHTLLALHTLRTVWGPLLSYTASSSHTTYGLSAIVVIYCSLFTHYVLFERYCCHTLLALTLLLICDTVLWARCAQHNYVTEKKKRNAINNTSIVETYGGAYDIKIIVMWYAAKYSSNLGLKTENTAINLTL